MRASSKITTLFLRYRFGVRREERAIILHERLDLARPFLLLRLLSRRSPFYFPISDIIQLVLEVDPGNRFNYGLNFRDQYISNAFN